MGCSIFQCFLFVLMGGLCYSGTQCDKYKTQLDETKDVTTDGVISALKSLEDKLAGIPGYSQKRRVSFYARLSKHVALGTTQTVIFDEVVTNNGHAYNKHTGHFTAPWDGTYYFATSFLNNGGRVHLQMMKNDQDVGRGTSYPDQASTGSINAIVNLRNGDVVLLRHCVGMPAETIFGNRRSQFVGYLL